MADYTCTLDEATLEKAEEELHEVPDERAAAIETFREWILDRPYIKCPTDARFLLMFLRAKKFSQLASRDLLEKYLERRQQFSEWFHDLDPSCAKIQSVLDTGVFLLLPGRDDEGRRVFILRPGAIDPSNKIYTKLDMFRAFACCLDTILMDELTQVHGTVTVVDLSGYTWRHQFYTTLSDRKNFIQSWQKHFPARVKGIHIYNTGAFAGIVLMIIKLVLSKKIQQRLTSHGQNLETFYKSIPMRMMPEDYLPEEYDGPTVGSIKDVIAGMKRNFAQPDLIEYVKRVSSSKYGIDSRPLDRMNSSLSSSCLQLGPSQLPPPI
ncbi:hypothetical protein LSAT2_007621 [Lamellibrachia satsuma]|nr:hypothetical protein LSAT2_007621 [Lamellibrachia satsuma]